MKKKIRDPSDFEWLKQSRFHWRTDRDTVVTSICDVDFEYSYEYLGTQRCATCSLLLMPFSWQNEHSNTLCSPV